MKTEFKISLVLIGLLLIIAFGCKKDKKLPELTTAQVTEITSTKSVSGGTITSAGESIILVRGVVWGTSVNPTIDGSKTSDGSGSGSFTSNISGLSPGTTYYLRSYASNDDGTAYGNTIIFQTLPSITYGEYIDSRDSNVYQTVTIGDQVWMAENLRFLPSVIRPDSGSATTAYYYVYGYEGTDVNAAKATENYQTYGVLYNWEAAYSSCPAGWHLPSDFEWKKLEMELGMSSADADEIGSRGTNQGSKLAGNSSLWIPGVLTSNFLFETSGFNALPGGLRSSDGFFENIGYFGYWWSATDYSVNDALLRVLYYDYSDIYRDHINYEMGFSVRCVKN